MQRGGCEVVSGGVVWGMWGGLGAFTICRGCLALVLLIHSYIMSLYVKSPIFYH